MAAHTPSSSLFLGFFLFYLHDLYLLTAIHRNAVTTIRRSRYVPPGSRGGGGGGGGPRGRGSRAQAAPDLTTMSFPSLSDAIADVVQPGDHRMEGFTTVEHGANARGSHRGTGGQVQGSRYVPPGSRGGGGGNQFSALGRG